MLDLGPDRIVRDIALQHPGAIRAFEAHRIDYCCGGARTLRDACAKAGVALDAVVADLEAEARASRERGEPTPLAGLSLEQLVVWVLERHHAFLWREDERICALARKVAKVHGGTMHTLERLEELVETLFLELRTHLTREERVLFPYLVSLSRADASGAAVARPHFGTLDGPTRVMELEHDAAGRLLEEMRTLTDGYRPPPEACTSWRGLYQGLDEIERDLMRHIHVENHVVFPAARELEARCRPARRRG